MSQNMKLTQLYFKIEGDNKMLKGGGDRNFPTFLFSLEDLWNY